MLECDTVATELHGYDFVIKKRYLCQTLYFKYIFKICLSTCIHLSYTFLNIQNFFKSLNMYKMGNVIFYETRLGLNKTKPQVEENIIFLG